MSDYAVSLISHIKTITRMTAIVDERENKLQTKDSLTPRMIHFDKTLNGIAWHGMMCNQFLTTRNNFHMSITGDY